MMNILCVRFAALKIVTKRAFHKAIKQSCLSTVSSKISGMENAFTFATDEKAIRVKGRMIHEIRGH